MLKFLKKLWDILRVILVVVLVCLAIWFTCGGALSLLGATFTGFSAALLCVGVAFVVDPETTKEALTAVTEAVAEVAATVASTLLDVAVDTFTSSKLFFFAAAGVVAWFLLGKKKEEKVKVSAEGESGRGEAESQDDAFVGPLEAA